MATDEIIGRELNPNEQIIWSGQPSLKKAFRGFDVFLVPFSVFWFGFALFWTAAATWGGGAFGLLGVPFVAVGFYFCIGRFIYKRSNKSRTHYALTDQRVIRIIVNREGVLKAVSSSYLNRISDDSFTIDKNRVGTIIFGPVPYFQASYLNTGLDFLMGFSHTNTTAFFDIENAKSVYDLYKSLQNQSA